MFTYIVKSTITKNGGNSQHVKIYNVKKNMVNTTYIPIPWIKKIFPKSRINRNNFTVYFDGYFFELEEHIKTYHEKENTDYIIIHIEG